MKKTYKNKLVGLLLISLFLPSCMSSFQAYDGDALPKEEVVSVYYPAYRPYDKGTEQIVLYAVNGVEVKRKKIIRLPPGKTKFTYKYKVVTNKASAGWTMLMLGTGIIPGAIVMVATQSSAEKKSPLHTIEADLVAGAFYNIEFNSPGYDKNNVKAWLVEKDIK